MVCYCRDWADPDPELGPGSGAARVQPLPVLELRGAAGGHGAALRDLAPGAEKPVICDNRQ